MPRKKRSEESPEDVQPVEAESGIAGDAGLVSEFSEEVLPEPEPAEEPTPETPAADLPLKPFVKLDVFVRTHPLKDDLLAGFKYWAAKHLAGAKYTIEQWREKYDEFMNRPVR